MKTQRELDNLAVRAELRLARFHKRFMEQYMKERIPQEEMLGEEENIENAMATPGASADSAPSYS